MKTLRFLLINLFVRDHKKTLEIINGLDQPSKGNLFDQKYPDHIGNFLLGDDSEEKSFVVKEPIELSRSTKVKQKTKKDELIDALNYLKSKPDKTKQDKESIYTLEVLLKSMS